MAATVATLPTNEQIPLLAGAFMFDAVITGGTLIDGTGEAARQADIAISGQRIAAIAEPGTLKSQAHEQINADGLIVCPGFIDPHTHYDAQIFWDPWATPSNLFGVTTAVGGNCGFSLAPLDSDTDAEYLKKMMVKVEGMSLDALETGVPWNWHTFADYLHAVESRGVGVNIAFMVGHCALRRAVMKEDAVGHIANDDQIALMRGLLAESLAAGGLGFSTGRSYTHDDWDGNPVPSRWASEAEVLELCRETGTHEGTTLEWVADGCMKGFSDSEVALMTNMSVEADRPINWNVLTIDSARPDDYRNQITACERAAADGATVVALTMPILVGMNMSLGTFCALHMLPGWGDIFGLKLRERIAKLKDRSTLIGLENDATRPEAGVFSRLTGWTDYVIGDTYSPKNEGLKGRRIGDIARERGQRDFFCLVDICIQDDLRTVLWPAPTDNDAESWRLRANAWQHPAVMIGGSDAGAHLDRMAGSCYPTAWIDDCLHGRQLTSVEDAVRHLTDAPAQLFGLRDRGRIAEGYFADIVIFDPDEVGATSPELVDDLPAGAKRLWSEATGVRRVMVNGTTTVVDGTANGTKPGTVLRSGRDTYTVRAGQG